MIDTLVEARAAGSGRLHRVRPRRVNAGRADGRWALLEPSNEGEEDRPLAWLGVLLERYGILTRELVELDPWAPAWADLAPLLARAELRGELRRGYFVSEEQNRLEKFRPYGVPSEQWIKEVGDGLRRRTPG